MTLIEELEALVSAVEEARADLAPTYSEYVRVAFAIANEFGESGRTYFHRICQLYTNGYDAAACERMYTSAIKDQRGGITFGTLMYLAKQAGVEVKTGETQSAASVQNQCSSHNVLHTHTRLRSTREESEDEKIFGADPSTPLPLFDAYDWPYPVNLCVNLGETPQQRDILFLASLTVIGAYLSNCLSTLYGKTMQYPNLQTFIVAPPASGKGIISHLRMLAEPLHQQLREQSKEELKRYKLEYQSWMQHGKEKGLVPEPEKPVNRMFLISGNNTGTGMLQNIIDNGGRGLIFESEADTVSTAIGSDYGHWSDTLRKAFDHDRLSYNRRTNNEFRECPQTFLSVLLSGTPAQVAPLIPSAENGLFSRQIFYYMPTLTDWRDQFGETESFDLHDYCEALGRSFFSLYNKILSHGRFQCVLSCDQRARFNSSFRNLYMHSQQMNGYEMNSSMARMGINIMRIISIVALLRAFESKRPDIFPAPDVPRDNIEDGIISQWYVYVNDKDLDAVLSLIVPMYRHTLHVLSFLETTHVKRLRHSERETLYNELPQVFTYTEARDMATERDTPENTLRSWLARWKRSGLLVVIERGKYEKPRART